MDKNFINKVYKDLALIMDNESSITEVQRSILSYALDVLEDLNNA